MYHPGMRTWMWVGSLLLAGSLWSWAACFSDRPTQVDIAPKTGACGTGPLLIAVDGVSLGTSWTDLRKRRPSHLIANQTYRVFPETMVKVDEQGTVCGITGRSLQVNGRPCLFVSDSSKDIPSFLGTPTLFSSIQSVQAGGIRRQNLMILGFNNYRLSITVDERTILGLGKSDEILILRLGRT